MYFVYAPAVLNSYLLPGCGPQPCHQLDCAMHECCRYVGRFLGLKVGLHAYLVRAVCNVPLLQPLLLPQLLFQLAVYKWNDPQQAAWLASLVPDLVDAVQSTEGMPGTALSLLLSLRSCHTGLTAPTFPASVHKIRKCADLQIWHC